jgi:ribosome-associated protein
LNSIRGCAAELGNEDMAHDDIPLPGGRVIPGSELSEQVSLSGGPGGQHANKTSSRVTLAWRVATSAKLTEATRVRLLERLASRLTKEGVLQVSVDANRSQHINRETARARLGEWVSAALKVERARRKTKPSRGAKQRRLDGKKRRSGVKKGRSKPFDD